MELNVLVFFPCAKVDAKKVFPLIAEWCSKEAVEELKAFLQGEKEKAEQLVKEYSALYLKASDKAGSLLTLISTGKHPVGTKATKEELADAQGDLASAKTEVRFASNGIKTNRKKAVKLERNIELLNHYLAKGV